ncbi:MAG: flagellar protein FlaG [Chlorobi bacterium]|jgi:flagellar protein FlaG|nr:flagellar protein FlaG [Chlorobiota bacterium]
MNEIGGISPSVPVRAIESPSLQQRTVESSSGSVAQQQSPLSQHSSDSNTGRAGHQGTSNKTTEAFFDVMQRQIQFTVDKETRRTIIKIVDPKTKEVVRQIPPDEALRISRMISRLVSDRGAVTDERI